MKQVLRALPIALLLINSPVIAAQDITGEMAELERRMCNLQARETALRISEEVDTGLNVDARNTIASIAEQVCLDYTASANTSASANFNESAGSSVNSAVNSSSDPETEESGLFGDLKIIEAEDRVRRPGLKRR